MALAMDPLREAQGPLRKMRITAQITARISLSFVVLTLLTLVFSFFTPGLYAAQPFIAGLTLVFLSLFVANAFQQVSVAAFVLCTLPSLLILTMTLRLKAISPGNDILYYNSRIALIGFCALPGIVFSPRDTLKLVSSIAIALLCLVFYDPIHESLGLGYYQRGFTGLHYYNINIVSIVIGISIIAGCVLLKGIVVREEDKNIKLYRDVQNQNHELETQNEEITSQTEQLSSAFAVIENQKSKLEEYATDLEALVDRKNHELSRSNEELRKHNSELRQFSYTVSHNLRGPLARLMGLADLVSTSRQPSDDSGNQKMLQMIRDSAREVDTVIRDLAQIIDIRNDLYIVKEKVFFAEEWSNTISILSSQITSDMTFDTDFSEAPYVYTIRPYLHSILYNLVSNAIRYRSPLRPLQVKLKTRLSNNMLHLSISDNGLGINLKLFGNSVFGMYKRFHTHTEGRGLGLYLVKTQAEALQGKVEVESQLNEGTTFILSIQLPSNIEGQLCFDSDDGSILYNARINSMGLDWKRSVSSEEYKNMLLKCLELSRIYRTQDWIADLRKRGQLSQEDSIWFAEAILNEASANGLQRIACIDTSEQELIQRERMSAAARKYNVEMVFFHTRREAEQWIESFYHGGV